MQRSTAAGYYKKSVTQHIQKNDTNYLLDLFIDKNHIGFSVKL